MEILERALPGLSQADANRCHTAPHSLFAFGVEY